MGQNSLSFNLIGRGGEYLRVADPDWEEPLDPAFAHLNGGRWNAPAAFPVLYLNADLETARANVDRKYKGLSYGVMDLRTDRRPLLVAVNVPLNEFADVVTDAGCVRANLPKSYPVDSAGREVTHAECQPIGKRAHDERLPGIACRSAARPMGEELAWFVDDTRKPTRTLEFDDWY